MAEIWDHAPAVILARDAGDRFRDLLGGQRINLGGAVFSNGAIDEQLDSVLQDLFTATGQIPHDPAGR